MCGIAGLFEISGRPVDTALLWRMTRTLAHRGPDDEAVWNEGHVGFGHCRLAIRDPSPAGRQPMSDPSGRVTVSYNGEIYNEAALRRELERDYGFLFRSRCDTEVIPAGYLAWGEEVFDRLEGMFAIALWDDQTERLFLARDGVGIKPLFVARYRARHGERWGFGSELKALLADPELPRRIDAEALHVYLAQGYVAPHRTLLEGVGQLPPGTVRRIDRDAASDRRFWKPQRTGEIKQLSEAVEIFLITWDEVLESITVSDVPIGILQSGGIDSSLVTLGLAGRIEAPAFIATFEERSHDEASLAVDVARAASCPHHLVPVEVDDVPGVFRRVVEHFDGQLADSSGFATYTLCAAARRRAPVVISGDGADELFGGYPTYRATRIAAALQGVPRSWLRGLGRRAWRRASGRYERLPKAEVVARFFDGATAPDLGYHAHWRRLLPEHLMDRVYGSRLQPLAKSVDPLHAYVEAIRQSEGDLVSRCLLADQCHYLPADMLMKVDAMSMAHGLEVRVPFLDRRIAELAGRLDTRLLTPIQGPDKRLLRHALQRLGGPPRVVSGRKKGFNVPVARLLQGPLAPLADRLLGTEADRLSPYLDPPGIRRMWIEQREGRGHQGYALWAILSLATWIELAEI